MKINCNELIDICKFCSNDKYKIQFTGVYFDADKKNVVATDGYRMVVKNYESMDFTKSVLLSCDDLLIIAKLVKRDSKRTKDYDVEITELDGKYILVGASVEMETKPINNLYVSYQQVIPTQCPVRKIKLNKKMLLDMIANEDNVIELELLENEASPIVVKTNGFTQLLMPVRRS